MPELLTESVGLHFRPSDIKRFVNESLTVGDHLVLEREPGNQYDSNAIKVLVEDEVQGALHIGYVPKNNNAVLAALMDQGLEPEARVFSFVGKNPQILIEWGDEPNEETRKAMEEARSNDLQEFETVEGLMEKLNSDEAE